MLRHIHSKFNFYQFSTIQEIQLNANQIRAMTNIQSKLKPDAG